MQRVQCKSCSISLFTLHRANPLLLVSISECIRSSPPHSARNLQAIMTTYLSPSTLKAKPYNRAKGITPRSLLRSYSSDLEVRRPLHTTLLILIISKRPPLAGANSLRASTRLPLFTDRPQAPHTSRLLTMSSTMCRSTPARDSKRIETQMCGNPLLKDLINMGAMSIGKDQSADPSMRTTQEASTL